MPAARISVVIPSYNDRDIIRPFHSAIVSELGSQTDYDWELIFVDDGSGDGSQGVLRDLALTDPRVTYVELARNVGQQIAIFVGMKYARGDYVVVLDGDFQYHPSAIIALARELDRGVDLVSGVRQRRQGSFLHRLGSRAGNFFLRRIAGIPIRDFGAIKAFRRHVVDAILQTENFYMNVYTVGLTFTDRIQEIEVIHLPRYSGSSKWTMWQRLYVLADVYFTAARHEFSGALRAIIVFGALAGLLTAAGLIGGAVTHSRAALVAAAVAAALLLYVAQLAVLLVILIFAIRVFRMNVRSRAYLISEVVRCASAVPDTRRAAPDG